MTTLETLKAARKMIEKPENWTQGELGRKADGTPIKNGAISSLGQATCFCAAGALLMVIRGKRRAPWNCLQAVMGDYVPSFNDTHTHAEVLAAFDAAIAKEQA
jgi:hypothetical protein